MIVHPRRARYTSMRVSRTLDRLNVDGTARILPWSPDLSTGDPVGPPAGRSATVPP